MGSVLALQRNLGFFLRFYDVLGCRVIDLQAIGSLFDGLLLLVHHGNQLGSLLSVYSLVAALGFLKVLGTGALS